MEKDYVLDHDWGSYNSNDSVNKLMLRNAEDFMKYFNKEIQNEYIAEQLGNYTFKFVNGTVIQFIPEIMR